MANANKGGRRLAGSRPAASYNPGNTGDLDATVVVPRTPAPAPSVDDLVVDDILRSISEQSSTPVPPARPAAKPAARPAEAEDATTAYRPVRENEYQAVASAMRRQAAAAQSQQTQNTVPPSDPYNMRDPAMTQSFQPARPAHRDTDRLPTLVDEKPVRRKTVLSKVLTFLVVILVIVALVLGIRMVYILGPAMGWNLPDVSNIPGVSAVLGVIPDPEEEIIPEDVITEPEQPAVPVQDPTSVTLDAEVIELHPGESAILTATLDVDGWDGLLAWASGKDEIATVMPLGPTTAQVDYVGEGSCFIAVKVGVKPADGSEAPSATCRIDCLGADEPVDATDPVDDQPSDGEDQPTGEHVDIALNREDFTLNVGESHKLMDQNADQVTWTSSNTAVATVNENGVVSAVGKGTATITATGPDGATASAIARVR